MYMKEDYLKGGFPMPPKRLRAKRAKAAVPEWSQKIATFRNGLKLSQSEFGKRLGASAMAVSRWERAIQEVPANIYIQLGIWLVIRTVGISGDVQVYGQWT